MPTYLILYCAQSVLTVLEEVHILCWDFLQITVYTILVVQLSFHSRYCGSHLGVPAISLPYHLLYLPDVQIFLFLIREICLKLEVL